METIFHLGKTWELWSSSFLWALIGIITYDAWMYLSKDEDFSIEVWKKKFLKSAGATFLGTLVVMKIGDSFLRIATALSSDIDRVFTVIQQQHLEPSQLALLVAVILKMKLDNRL